MKRSTKKGAALTMVFQVLYGEVLMRHERYESMKTVVTSEAKQEMERFYEGVSIMMLDLYPFAEAMKEYIAENLNKKYVHVPVNQLFLTFERMILNCISRIDLFPPEMGRTIEKVGFTLEFVIKPILDREKLSESMAEDIAVTFWELVVSLRYCLGSAI